MEVMDRIKKRYGIFRLFRLCFDFVNTKLFYKRARIIKVPYDIRGRNFIDFGRNLTIGRNSRIEVYELQNSKNRPLLKFGKNVQLNDFVHITVMGTVEIGDNTLIASKVYISDCSHGIYSGTENDTNPQIAPIERQYKIGSVKIGKNVWIGEFVSILPNVEIGDGVIIGTMSVVNKSIPPYCIAVGCPAKIIKRFNFSYNKWEKI